jgi:hypothetical protein
MLTLARCKRTDEQVCELDILPKIFPDLLLRRSSLVDQIAPDLDMRSVDDRQLGPNPPN